MTLHIVGVAQDYVETLDVTRSPLVIYGLLTHENKVI